MLQTKLKQVIAEAVQTNYGDVALLDFSVDVPEMAEHGDYACNAAMMLARVAKKNPMEIAQALASVLEKNAPDLIKKIIVAAPGFINMFIHDSVILAVADDALKRPGAWGKGQEGKGKTVIVEYLQLNVAKEPHVGICALR